MLRNYRGLTLLELLVVITIFGIILAVALPRIFSIESAYLGADARRIAGLIRYMNEAAATRRAYYRVSFNLNKEQIRVETSLDGIEYREESESFLSALRLKNRVEIEDVVLPGLGVIKKGEVSVIFSPLGSAEPFNIHLKSNNNFLTLAFNHYNGRVKIIEGYV
jgi:prepilin-type N-terminal cleavage/methylation domain-containing protein